MYIMFKSLLLLLLSFLLFISGVTRLIIGLLILGYCSVRELTQCYNLYVVPITSGINQLFFSFTGFNYCKNNAITKGVMIILCMSVVLDIITGVLLYQMQTADFRNTIIYTYIGQADHSHYQVSTFTLPLVDDMQRYLSCCGTWNTTFPQGHKLPLSCCEKGDIQMRLSYGQLMEFCVAGRHHKTPCVNSLTSFIYDYAWMCITFSIPIFEVMVTYTIMAIQRSQQHL